MPRKRDWGEGTIEELPSGQWRARLPAGRNPSTGKRVRPSKTFDKETHARAWLRGEIAKRDRGQSPSWGGSVSLEEYSVEWLAMKKLTVGARSWENYESHFRVHILPGLGQAKLKDLTALAIRKWVAELGAGGQSPANIHKILVTLGVCLNSAVEDGRIPASPLRGKAVPRPKVRKAEIEIFTEAEAKAILEAASGERLWPCLWMLLLDSGMRPGEAAAITWGDLDAVAGTVRIRRSLERVDGEYLLKEPKSVAGNRTVKVSPPTWEAIARHREAMAMEGHDTVRGTVFVSAAGGYLSRDTVHSAFERAQRKAKVPRRKPYALRHTSAALLLANGVNIRTISRRLGHEDIAVTLRHYAGLMPDADEVAAGVMGEVLGK